MTLRSLESAVVLFGLLPLLFALLLYYVGKKLLSKSVSNRFQSTVLFTLFGFGLAVSVLSALLPTENKFHRAGSLEWAKLKAEAHKDTLKGIDVSHYNGTIDWHKVKGAGVQFAYAKATQGTDFHDPKFKENWAGMKAADIARGAYHFYVPNVNPQAQADFFCSFVDSIGATDMPPMLDLEGSGIGGLTTETYMEQVLQWLSAVEKRFGRTPIIYVDNPFANQYLTDPHFARYPLWVAEYGPVAHIPHTWANSAPTTAPFASGPPESRQQWAVL